MTQYEMGLSVMDFLQNLGIDMITIGDFVEDKMLKKSYQIIKNNPKANKKEIMEKLNQALNSQRNNQM